MRGRDHVLLILPTLLLAKSAICAPQQKPVTRTFVAGSEEHYQVTATIRAETHGVSTEKIGEKTYAKPFTHTAEGSVSWRATRKVTAVKNDGTASITESLDQFRANCESSPQTPGGSPA